MISKLKKENQKIQVSTNERHKGTILKRCAALILCVVMCLSFTGCDLTLYKEVMTEETFLEGDLVQLPSQIAVEKQVEKEILVPADKVTSNTSSGGSISDYINDEEEDGPWKNKTSDICFWPMGVSLAKYGMGNPDMEAYLKTDAVNTSNAIDPTLAVEMGKYNVKSWGDLSGPYYAAINCIDGGSDPQPIYDAIDDVYQKWVDAGADEYLLGWYLDEPARLDAVKMVSKYAQKYGKRFFCIFTMGTLDKRYAAGGDMGSARHVSPENTQYMTDIGTDNYYSINEYASLHEETYKVLHEKMHPDLKVWYVPFISNGESLIGNKGPDTENAVKNNIAFMEQLYERLKKEKNPGGLAAWAYNYDSSGGEGYIGAYQLWKSLKGDAGTQELMDVIHRIGREICTGTSGM